MPTDNLTEKEKLSLLRGKERPLIGKKKGDQRRPSPEKLTGEEPGNSKDFLREKKHRRAKKVGVGP